MGPRQGASVHWADEALVSERIAIPMEGKSLDGSQFNGVRSFGAQTHGAQLRFATATVESVCNSDLSYCTGVQCHPEVKTSPDGETRK